MKTIIIGAGVAGLSIGWKLAQAGVEVQIFERAEPARGATWAAAGMIAPTMETESGPQSESEFARWSAALWPDFAADIEKQSGRKIGYQRDGALLVAMTQSEMDTFSRRNSATMLNGNEVRAREPLLTDTIAGAMWDSAEARVDNRALGRALIAACLRAGVTISPLETVVKIEVAQQLVAYTPFTWHFADKIVVAAGAWTGEIAMPNVPPTRGVKGEMIALTPPAGAAMPNHVVWGNGVYLVPRRGRLLIGATMEEAGLNTTLTDAAENWLWDRAIALMPSLASWKVEDHWAGLRPAAPDGLPILGETATPNLYIATGQFRNGILFAPAVAEAMSRLILGKDAPEIRAFSPQRFAAAS
ncbi:MAG TPA: glycine oxidase ThiO [Rhizomicrobium sp.]|nr:glycine oxidase ThiO [Rhizomicrobium sp.]